MLRQVLPRRVVVSLGISFALVGAIVLAGALLRHHDPPTRAPRAPASTVTLAPRVPVGR